MFSKTVSSLKEVSSLGRWAITAFLVLAGIGYLLGFFNIWLSYSPVDEKPGLSLKDIEYAFYGKREATKLEKAVDGSMHKYFTTDEEYQMTKAWLEQGAPEDVFQAKIQPVFDDSCSTCHSAQTKVAQVVTEKYADLQGLLAMDTGKSVARLVSLSHTHLLSTLTIIFLLNLIFFYTAFPEWLKRTMVLVSFGAVLLDIGSWWLAKLAPFFSIFVVIGGASLGLSFLLLTLLPLYEIWLKKAG